MRYTILIILFILSSTILTQSQDFNQVDSQGLKQGKWRKTYPNGALNYEGQFINDKPFGTFKHYYENAQVKAITRFSDDGLIALTKSYHENGQPLAEGKYINQLRDSTWSFYSDIDGSLVSKEEYHRGELNGKSTLYFPENGQIAEVTSYINGVREGPYIKYFPDGKIMTEGNYLEDMLDGSFVVYFNDGNTAIKGLYKRGIKEGNWAYYSEDGKQLTEEEFKEQDEVQTPD